MPDKKKINEIKNDIQNSINKINDYKEIIKDNSTKYIDKFLNNLSLYINLFNKLNNLVDNLNNYQNIKTIIDLNIKKINKDINNYISNIYKLIDFKSEITMIYKKPEYINKTNNQITIFREEFVKNNKNNYYLYINNKKNDLCSSYDHPFDKSELLNIKLVEKSPVNNTINDLIDQYNLLFYSSFNSDFIIIEEEYEFKVLIVGNVGVGKTLLLNKLINGVWIENMDFLGSFESINFKIAKRGKKSKNCTLTFEDCLCSHGHYEAHTKWLFKYKDIFIILYDITDRGSLGDIDRYSSDIKKNKPNAIIFLMGTKNDLISERKVEIEEAKKICQKYNINWGCECSAKTTSQKDLINIFKKFTYELIKKNKY